MNTKMTTNSQLSTTEPKKKQKHKQIKQTTRNGTESNGDHMEGYQRGRWRSREVEKVQRLSSINDR